MCIKFYGNGYKQEIPKKIEWSNASKPIWAIVCGLPAGKRERRQIFMLKAFIDDSKSHQGAGVCMLAGYVGPAEMWASFSDEWQRVLDMNPRINYFKLREAMKQQREFYGRPVELCNERIACFRAVIEKFGPVEVALGFRIDAYQKAYSSWGPKHKNPYFFASAGIMAEV